MLKVLRAEFGSLPLEEITYARIKTFALKLRQTPIRQHPDRPQTPATCNRKLALLRHILRMAWKEGLIEKLPAVDLFQGPADLFIKRVAFFGGPVLFSV